MLFDLKPNIIPLKHSLRFTVILYEGNVLLVMKFKEFCLNNNTDLKLLSISPSDHINEDNVI